MRSARDITSLSLILAVALVLTAGPALAGLGCPARACLPQMGPSAKPAFLNPHQGCHCGPGCETALVREARTIPSPWWTTTGAQTPVPGPVTVTPVWLEQTRPGLSPPTGRSSEPQPGGPIFLATQSFLQ